MIGVLHSINVSNGGVPKRPRSSCHVWTHGLDGDAQDDLRYHGGPDRAVSLYSFDLIQSLQAEGHPITPGSTGENLTLAGLNWHVIAPGVEIHIGPVVVVVTEPADPCKTIGASFRGHSFGRILGRRHPGWSRMYARVLKEGVVAIGDPVECKFG